MISKVSKSLCLLGLALFSFIFPFGAANAIDINASKLLPHVEVSFSPRTGSYVEGSTFNVPLLINTKGTAINGIEIRINFDKNKLAIVQPSGGTSIIGVWVQPPQYDNTHGTASYVGVIPGGITTSSGLVGMITFKALSAGPATVSVETNSKVLLNDGLGTEAILDLSRSEYTVLTKAPEGPNVFSETHPFQEDWYNNNSPIISWQRDEGVTGYSFELDNKPFTIPDNTLDTNDTTKAYPNLADGLWYFHIKSIKNGVWGTTAHFLVRIDTTPPAEFKPESNYLVAAAIMTERTLVSFFTTDNLSGVDHYEVGVIDKSQPTTASPAFVEAQSPFQVPISKGGNLTAIVRAIDKAGNVRDESIDVKPPFIAGKFIQDYLVYILILIILLGMVVLVTHYLLGHHIIRYVKRVMQMMKREELADEAHEISPEIKAVEAVPEPPSAPLQNTVTIPKPPMEVMEIPKDPNQSNT